MALVDGGGDVEQGRNRGPALGIFLEGLFDLFERAIDASAQQRILVVHVIVERTAAHAEFVGDVAQSEVGVALAVEIACAGAQESLDLHLVARVAIEQEIWAVIIESGYGNEQFRIAVF